MLQTRGRAVRDEEWDRLQARVLSESIAPLEHPLDNAPITTAALAVLKKAVRCRIVMAGPCRPDVTSCRYPCNVEQVLTCEESLKAGMSNRGSNWFTKAREADRSVLVR